MLSTELGLSKGWLLSWWLLFVLSTLYAKIKRKWVLINEIPQPLDHRRWRGSAMQMEQWEPPRARAPFQCTVSHAALTGPQHWSGVLFCSWLPSSLDVSCLTPPGPWWPCCYPPRQPIFLLQTECDFWLWAWHWPKALGPCPPSAFSHQVFCAWMDVLCEMLGLHHCLKELLQDAKRKHNSFLLGPSCVTTSASGIKIEGLFIAN